MADVTDNAADSIHALLAVVAQLRNPEGGCPWDLAQTATSLTPYVLEEAYETVDAIRHGTPDELKDELGDLLLQVVLQAQIAQEAGLFSFEDVAATITAKLIRRHPHVFADQPVESVEAVNQTWDAIKAKEQGTTALAPQLAKYTRSLPPLTAATKIARKVAAAGFEWPDFAAVWAKFEEELAELEVAIAQETAAEQEAELGDVLFTLINVGRWLKLDPARALEGHNQRFLARWTWVEAHSTGQESTLADVLALWRQAKVALAPSKPATNTLTETSAKLRARQGD